jgi:type I restriction enzyme S subunit
MDAFAGAVGVSNSDGKGSPVYSVCEALPNANAGYYAYIIREMARSQWILALATGIRERSTDFRYGDFACQTVPVPPLCEQTAIVRYLDHADRKVRHAIRARQQLIKLLTEQKQAIIQRAVTRGLDPNVRLKPSGVPWLGQVPEHWEVSRLKHLCRFAYGNSLPSEIRQDGGIPVFGSNGRVGLHSVANTRAPCIVVGRKGSFGKVNFSDTPVFAIDTTYYVDERFTHANLRWLSYLLASLGLDGVSKDSAIPGLDRGDVYDQVVSYPIDTREQALIVQYIDGATAYLDKAIDAVRREIDLLREYRTRLIADVVTGKLDVRGAEVHLSDEPEEQPELLDEEPVAETSDVDAEESDGDQSEDESRDA